MVDKSWKKETFPAKKNSFQEVLLEFSRSILIPSLTAAFELQWEDKGAGEEEDESGWEGLFRSPTPTSLYLFQTLSVSHYSHSSLRDLTHWNPVKALRQQHRQKRDGWAKRERAGERARDTTEVRQNTRRALSPIFPPCARYPNLH